MVDRTDIVIAGGGLNGTALALALAGAGLRVALVDPVPRSVYEQDGFDGRGYALSLASRRLFEAIGVWPAVAASAQPILQIKVSDGRPGQGPAPFFLEFDHDEIEDGPMGFMVEDRFLRRALLAACADNDRIDRIEDAVIGETPRPAGIDILLKSGGNLAGSVLIACDGRNSAIACRAGIRRITARYQTALVCAVAHEKSHDGIAHQFFMPHGPLAILPLPGRRSSIVWAETAQDAARIAALADDDFLAELRPRFGDFLGPIALAGKRFAYPLGLSLAESFVAERRALVGDAAHGMHPIAGQGLNAGLKDVAALAEILVMAHRRGEDIGRKDVLDRYQRWRRFDVATLVMATDGFNRLFSNDRPGLRLLRDLGIGVVGAMPGLRRAVIREAAGLTGDVPRLMRGQPI